MPETTIARGVQEVGETAGQVWHYLRRAGRTSLAGVERGMEAPKQLTHMAIGWLAREGKIDLAQDGRAVQVWLTE